MKLFSVLFFFIILIASEMSWGACTSPAGVAGQMQYVSSVMKLCNGTAWVNTVATLSTSCAGTTAGTIGYSGGSYRFCDGTNWYLMKGSALTGCGGTTAGTKNWNGSTMRFCDGTNWYDMAPTVSSFHSGITYSTDGAYGSCTNPNETTMNDESVGDKSTWGSNNSGVAWIQADLGSSKNVSGIRVGGAGPNPCWAPCAQYWNPAGANVLIQTSPDASTWTTRATGNAITYSDSSMQNITFTSVSARYVRIHTTGYWMCTGQFRILN